MKIWEKILRKLEFVFNFDTIISIDYIYLFDIFNEGAFLIIPMVSMDRPKVLY